MHNNVIVSAVDRAGNAKHLGNTSDWMTGKVLAKTFLHCHSQPVTNIQLCCCAINIQFDSNFKEQRIRQMD